MKNHIAFLVFVSSLAICTQPALSDANQDVAKIMAQYKQKKPIDTRYLFKAPALKVLRSLDKYRNDKNERVRSQALNFIMATALRDNKPNALQEGVRQLLETAKKDPSVADNAFELLLRFPRAGFAQAKSRQTIRQFFLAKEPYPATALLAGIAEDQSLRPRLKKLSQRSLDILSWNAHLALARLGDKKEIQFCIGVVDAVRDPVAQIAFFKDLDYIRQPETAKKLIEYLLGDLIVPGSPPDVPTTPYADYALPILSKSIVGFPHFDASQGEGHTWLARARAWSRLHQNNLVIKR